MQYVFLRIFIQISPDKYEAIPGICAFPLMQKAVLFQNH